MAYKPTKASAYMVAWPTLGIVKTGYSYVQRWKPFLARGAILIGVDEYDDSQEAFQRESDLEWLMAEVADKAFTNREQAVDILGSKGSGWTECWAATPEQGRRVFHG